MSDARRGVGAMIAACTVWGLSPLYWKMLAHLPAIEVLSHRTFWSAVSFVMLLLLQGRLTALWREMRQLRTTLTIFLAALMISTNWFLFIWAIGVGKGTEASLGYFLFPLVSVVAGRIIYKETLVPAQWGAVALAALGVIVLTLGLGAAPWIALVLASTFGLYGVIKKGLSVGPVLSVTGEVVLLAPVAIYLIATSSSGLAGLEGPPRDIFLLVASGVVTATPLILFSYATKRVALSTVGVVQYLNPSLQFMCAVVIFSEPVGLWHAIAFPMIWAALVIYTWAAWSQEKTRARAVSNASTSGII